MKNETLKQIIEQIKKYELTKTFSEFGYRFGRNKGVKTFIN